MKNRLLWITAVLLFSFVFTSAVQAENKEMYVDVSVATLWSEPADTRDVDAPAISNPVDMWEWTENMTYEQKLGLVGKLQTQALYGQKVTILEEKGDWVKVAVHGQPTPKNELGYPAWMPKEQLADEKRYSTLKDKKPFALVTSPTAHLYDDKNRKKEFKEISFNTKLPVVTQAGDSMLVVTPSDGMKWINEEDASVYESEDEIPEADGEDLVETGKQFLGLPYLWAGASGFGFDCSGFTHTIFKSHGITIPRDSSVQAENGTPVAKEDLQEGDLLFFAYDEGEGYVHHVGMYIGDGEMIHSPNSASTVEIIDVFESDYAVEFAGARRYLD
ncbi:C40 family peptidase [Salimicrobium humidisoli]|uniref:Peptidase P60 n=1 Tax=Salimicrobium humidisoli TaxID=2029857 RepID=A0ABX4HSV4_9BACI|nr:C40 family peptidase [Salimicrobium humidisoli]PBB06304.1 peptidase P60 [Salimicrobium humidisoli]